MRVAFVFALALLLSRPAFAESVSTPPPPGGVVKAPDGGLVISSQTCAELGGDASVPSADYQPGLDVNGNGVAPADLPSSGASSPTIENFPIEIDQSLAGKFNLPPGAAPKAILGYVTVRDNQAYFNGQPLNADQNAALQSACKNAKQH
ncbi:MAG TPA: hypothetical protein VKV32_03105 [Stellaceae bacterium]|nr:hypothetical protein [Stellaceae bacterium]